VQKYASAFGMNVVAFGRGTGRARGARLYKGKEGLDEVLRKSDVVLLSIPLSRFTTGLIGGRELSLMKEDATLVNIARGDLVDQKALYAHLTSHPNFKYAADAWWFREGRESLETDFPFATLRNFVGTPHMSGPTGVASGRPARLAVDNVLRYLGGKTPLHIVDRKEYEAP
jgi:glycerate dehydrogenase